MDDCVGTGHGLDNECYGHVADKSQHDNKENTKEPAGFGDIGWQSQRPSANNQIENEY